MAFARPQAIQQFAPIGDDGTDGQAILVDTTGRILAVIQTALPSGDAAIGRVKVTDGTDVALVTAAGELSVNVGNAGDIGGGTQYTEDAPAAADPIGTALIMVRDDALSAQTTADGDNVAVRGTDKGELYVKHADTMVVDGSAVTQPVSLASVPSHAVTNAGTFAVQEASGAAIAASLSVVDDWDNAASDGASVSGDVAHDSADAGEPVKVGFKAISPDGTAPPVVAENDRSNANGDLNGRQYVNTVHPENFSYHYDSTSAVVTDGTVHADPGDGFAVFITDIVFSIGVATASSIFIEESTTKILGPYYLEAIAGRGLAVHFKTPKRCTASTEILVTTTGATTLAVDILGFVAAV